MKKLLLSLSAVLLLVFFSSLSVQAQRIITVGPRIGINGAQLTGSNAPSGGSLKPGLNAGGFFTYSTLDNYGFTIELLYSMKGERYATPISEGTGTTANQIKSYRLNYLEIPVTFRYYFFKFGDPVRPNLFVGPYGAYNLSANTVNKSGAKTDVNEQYSNLEAGIVVGAGVNVKISQRWFNFDLRYNHGLTRIIESDTNPKVFNGVFSFGIAYGIALDKKKAVNAIGSR